MTIHHSTLKRAEKMGVILMEINAANLPDYNEMVVKAFRSVESDIVQAFWPQYNMYAFGADGKAAVNQMEALQQIKSAFPDCQVANDSDDPFLVRVYEGPARERTPHREPMLPTDVLAEINESKEWLLTAVPENGGDAYRAKRQPEPKRAPEQADRRRQVVDRLLEHAPHGWPR